MIRERVSIGSLWTIHVEIYSSKIGEKPRAESFQTKSSINVKTRVDDGGTPGDTGCQIEKLVKNANRRYVGSGTNGGPPQRDCTSRIYRPFGRESVILWTQMRRCLRAEHLSRVSCERKGTGGGRSDPLYACRWCPLCNEAQPSQYWLQARLMDLPRVCI